MGCQANEPKFYIGVSQCSDDEWRDKMNSEIETESWFYDHVEVEFRNAFDNTEQQRKDIDYFKNKGVDLLIVAPNEGSALTSAIQSLMNDGVPVIVVDRKTDSEIYTAYIGGDNLGIGRAVGKYMGSAISAPAKVVEITGLPGATSSIERSQGFKEGISGYPNLKLIATDVANWLEADAYVVMQKLLMEHADIDVVFAHNDRMAKGAYRAALEFGRADAIQFYAIDGLPGPGYGIEQVKKGELQATFIYPTYGDVILQTAIQILTHQPYLNYQLLSTSVIDKSNVEIVDLQTKEMVRLSDKIGHFKTKTRLYYEQNQNQKILLWVAVVVLLLVGTLSFLLFRSLNAKAKLNRKLRANNDLLEEQKTRITEQRDQLLQLSEQLEVASQAKINFFTNVSHDFRTPLTLIIDPINRLLSKPNLNAEEHQLLEMAQRNGKVLLGLINQVLDFRRVVDHQLPFRAERLEVAHQFKDWAMQFAPVFQTKNIAFEYTNTMSIPIYADVDIEKLERIFYNLLSNAVKFTPERGVVTVHLRTVDESLQFTVCNTGSFLEPSQIAHLFDQFYQVEENHSGSGIGLAVSKAFIEAHGGDIMVESDAEIGTTFTVTLPLHHAQVNGASEEIGSDVPLQVEAIDGDGVEQLPSVDEQVNLLEEDIDRTTLLIIDDNRDIRHYVKSLFKDNYRILEADNGVDGLALARRTLPDLIVSDVMMPKMNGIEFCKAIKENVETSHIPVILLTAKALDEHRIEGYQWGADSYISKPFSGELLTTRVANLLDQRAKLKDYFHQHKEEVKPTTAEGLDHEFIANFKKLVEMNMSNSSLKIEDLGSELGFSRVQLYRKVKAMTGSSPHEVLRNYRLSKARQMLLSKKYSVSEVCYEVGFTSPSYFAKSFKEEFNESPSDLIKG